MGRMRWLPEGGGERELVRKSGGLLGERKGKRGQRGFVFEFVFIGPGLLKSSVSFIVCAFCIRETS